MPSAIVVTSESESQSASSLISCNPTSCLVKVTRGLEKISLIKLAIIRQWKFRCGHSSGFLKHSLVKIEPQLCCFLYEKKEVLHTSAVLAWNITVSVL